YITDTSAKVRLEIGWALVNYLESGSAAQTKRMADMGLLLAAVVYMRVYASSTTTAKEELVNSLKIVEYLVAVHENSRDSFQRLNCESMIQELQKHRDMEVADAARGVLSAITTGSGSVVSDQSMNSLVNDVATIELSAKMDLSDN